MPEESFKRLVYLSTHTPVRDDVIQGAEKVSVNASDEDTTTDITDNQELSVDVETASSHTGIPT